MGLIYRAYETRSEIGRAAVGRDPDGAPLYPGRHNTIIGDDERRRRVDAGEPYALRLDMAGGHPARRPAHLAGNRRRPRRRNRRSVAANPAIWGDVILARKETPTSYHLAVVVDDAAQGVTDVVRGRDLFHATSVHRLLQALLGFPAPRYHHHRLILDAEGHKLSKSTAATGLRELRAQGATPADIRKSVGLD